MYPFSLAESNINFPMTDDLLLCFLRSRKFDLHRALKLVLEYLSLHLRFLYSLYVQIETPFKILQLKNYIKMIKNYPELFTNLRVARLKHVFDRSHLLVPPKREQNGRRVLMLNARKTFSRNHFQCRG